MANPESFVVDQFPRKYWSVIPTVLRTAYGAVDNLVQNEPILQVNSARDNKGRLISWAVDLGIQRAIVNGSIDCDYCWKDFAKPTGRYLELRFSHSTASVSQVADPRFQPRSVAFRENARLSNQCVFDFGDEDDSMQVSGLPHFLILHGHQELSFAHLGLPSAHSSKFYSWRSPNLMHLPHELHSDLPATEVTDNALDDLELLKEDIDKWRRDNDND
ncbi:hypothetical protein [Pyruvatibacter mobilis]|uniref:hypothetical protein n=1 Tax=Pyruvatibacter mobilis TaxID=1712261 RepID=UPI003D0C4169